MSEKITLVAGAGGLIGGYLVAELLDQGHKVRAVDVKPFGSWYRQFDAAENLRLDLRDKPRASPRRGMPR